LRLEGTYSIGTGPINLEIPAENWKEKRLQARKLHRIIGLVLLIPFFGWALTGFVFFVKPGYAGAYEILRVKTYPLATIAPIAPEPAWREIRYFRTILGDHLLVRTDNGWENLDPTTRQPRAIPQEAQLKRLLSDAFSINPSRYGSVLTVSGDRATTSTGVQLTLDWNSMSLQQSGLDTNRIDRLYKIHYLQWTGIKSLDRVLGFTGIFLILTLSGLGAWIAFIGNPRR